MNLKDYRKKRIARAIDWIKQPCLDVERFISGIIYKTVKLLQKNRSMVGVQDRILIIRRNRLGDAISVLPLVQALKARYPEMVIDILANPYNAPIFQASEYADEVYIVPERYLTNRYLVCFHPEMRRLRSGINYDITIGATGSYSSATAWLAKCSPSINRVGVISRNGSVMDLVYDTGVDQDEILSNIHQVQKIAYLAQRGGLDVDIASLPEPIIKTGQPTKNIYEVALCPMTNRSTSNWPDHKWAMLSRMLHEAGMSVLWIGHKPTEIEENVHYPVDVQAFMRTLERVELVVCPEGGTSHLAPALGCAAVVLSGVCISESWIPWSSQIVLFERSNDIESISEGDVLSQIRYWMKYRRFQKTGNSILPNHHVNKGWD